MLVFAMEEDSAKLLICASAIKIFQEAIAKPSYALAKHQATHWPVMAKENAMPKIHANAKETP